MISRSHSRIILLIVAAGALSGSGCARGPARAALSGRVSIDDVPVRFGSVVVVSEDGKHSGSGSISDDGTYLVPDAPVGPVKIAVTVPERTNTVIFTANAKVTPQLSEKLAATAHPSDSTPPELAKAIASVPPIPQAYRFPDASGLRTTVEKSGSNYDLSMITPRASPAGGSKPGTAPPRPPGLPPHMPWPPS